MAKDDKKKKKKQKSEPKKRGGFWTILFMIVLSLALIIFTQMTFVLLILGILPTIVAYFIDTSASRSLFHTVMACNLSGVLPFVAELIAGGNQTSMMQMMISDLEVLLMMYLSAALGWLLIFAAPHIARWIITSINQRKINRLKAAQKRLVAEWGQEITQPQTD